MSCEDFLYSVKAASSAHRNTLLTVVLHHSARDLRPCSRGLHDRLQRAARNSPKASYHNRNRTERGEPFIPLPKGAPYVPLREGVGHSSF